MLETLGADETRGRISAAGARLILRVMLATLLGGAAVLKFQSSSHHTLLGFCLTLVLPSIEIGLAIWFVSGIYFAAAVRCACALFLCFFLYAAFEVSQGARNCGCFGQLVAINPFFTAAADLVVLFFLLRSEAITIWTDATRFKTIRTIAPVLTIPLFGILVSIEIAAFSNRSTQLLDTSTWEGLKVTDPQPKQLLGDVVSEIKDFATIVVFRSNCDECRETVERVIAASANARDTSDYFLIELPPYGPPRKFLGSCHFSRAKEDIDWVVQTPLVLHIRNGSVIRIEHNFP